ncbi:MAG: hypothetical protein LBT98_04385 [Puniceicoccales bacterium]|jgi:hypothetical protein|nr:hypothetical protein [Puniceicoccales bacterium]
MSFLFNLFFKPIQWIFSFFFGFIAFAFLILAAVALTFNLWAPKAAPLLLRGGSDFALGVGRSESNLFTMNFNFYDVSIRNGSRYPVANFAQVDRISADLLFLSLFTRRVVVERFAVDLPQVTCVRDAEGRVNVAEFLTAAIGDRSKSSTGSFRRRAARPRQIRFRHVEIHLGKVVLMDFSEQPSHVREIALNYSYVADDVDAEALLRRLSSDLRARGAGLLVQSLLHSFANWADLSSISGDILRSSGLDRGNGAAGWRRGKSR